MVDLAQQAFSTNNLDLAAQIYARTIQENGPSTDLYLGLADSYARGDQLEKAFRAYSNAFRSGNVSPNQLNHLVTALVNKMSEREHLKPKSKPGDEVEVFACGTCKGLWNDPVTISCGHTYCRKCLEKSNTKTCEKCGVIQYYTRGSSLKTNVTLSSCIDCWFPTESKAVKLKDKGNALFSSRKYEEAIGVYSQALELVPTDHLLVSNRSCAYAFLDKNQEALKDAELCVVLRPDWAKAYYRKGMALTGMSRHEEAALAHLQCLTLDASVTSARTALAKTLHNLLSPLPPEDVKMAELQAWISLPLRRVLGTSSFPQPDLGAMPHGSVRKGLNEQMLERVKDSLRGNLIQPGMLQPGVPQSVQEESAHHNDVPTHAASATNVERPHSAPNSCPHSPKVEKRIWSSVSLDEEDGKLPRKRPSDFIHQPESNSADELSTAQPCKLARPTLSHKVKCKETMDALTKEHFECALCLRLLYHPVTTPCGHTFCRQCLDRCLDHRSKCPLCKSCLAEYLAERRQATTEAIELILQNYFPNDYQERKEQYEQNMAELARMGQEQFEIPVFVCTLAFPTISCPLHVFEPRYRLMIRQCMESGTRQFGMCNPSEDESSFADFGTMLEIRNVQYFVDGRSVVETVGGRRFWVITRGHRDGYDTAKVEFIKDRPIMADEQQEVQKLHDEFYMEAYNWFTSLPPGAKELIQKNFGSFPEREANALELPNGPAWLWWVPAVLPLPNRVQLTLLAMNSLRDRLTKTRKILDFVRQRESQ